MAIHTGPPRATMCTCGAACATFKRSFQQGGHTQNSNTGALRIRIWFGTHYTITIITNPQNSIGKYQGPYFLWSLAHVVKFNEAGDMVLPGLFRLLGDSDFCGLAALSAASNQRKFTDEKVLIPVHDNNSGNPEGSYTLLVWN